MIGVDARHLNREIKPLIPTQGRNSMRNSLFANIRVGAFVLVAIASAPLSFAAAHEAHKATCSEAATNALKADIQAMPDGDPKTKAMKELAMAEEMMGKDDMKGCEAHMHNAMEAVEE